MLRNDVVEMKEFPRVTFPFWPPSVTFRHYSTPSMSTRFLLSLLRRRSRHQLPLSILSHSRHLSSPSVPVFSRSYSSTSVPDSDFSDSTSLTTISQTLPETLNNHIDHVDSILPIQAVISLLDSYHDFTSLPWWLVISSSTLALRLALFPLLILQLRKLKKIQDSIPKLPPPIPPPFSGKSYLQQFTVFRKERLASGCPSFLWFFAYFGVQVPCFFLWMTTIRRMSLNHHLGFDCGGSLWFQNLTEYPHGLLGAIFPVLVAGLHFTNIQISFHKSSMKDLPGPLGLLAKIYRAYLNLLSVPLFCIGFWVPQGSLVYWVTNSSITTIQQLSLRHPVIRQYFGLPEIDSQERSIKSERVDMTEIKSLVLPTELPEVSGQALEPDTLLKQSNKYLEAGDKETALSLLRLALNKDPDNIRVLLVTGDVLVNQELSAEAAEYYERAVSKLLHAGDPTETEKIYHLIYASKGASVARMKQNKKADAMVHLERIASLHEPEHHLSKVHYFEGLLILSSALLDDGRKAEAKTYMLKAAAFEPSYNTFLEQLFGDNDFVKDLVDSRRAD